MDTRATGFHDKRARLSLPMDRDHTAFPPPVTQQLIDLLHAPGDIDLDAIEVAMQTLAVDADALGDAVYSDHVAYVRTLLYRDERAEMLALTWLPGQRSPVHDHGASTCVVRVVSGVATENLYRPREGGAEKRAYMTRDLRTGLVVRAPGTLIHSLGNNAEPGGETLVTLHIYSPPLGAK
jgi:predicted metal-dependent enzyme (double-stranded beta helix superfamily)